MLLCTALLYIPCCSGDVHSSCFQLLITTKFNDYFHPHPLTTPRESDLEYVEKEDHMILAHLLSANLLSPPATAAG